MKKLFAFSINISFRFVCDAHWLCFETPCASSPNSYLLSAWMFRRDKY